MLPLICFAKGKEKDHIVLKTNIDCFKAPVLIAQLRDKFGEEPIFIGKSLMEEETATFMFVNQESGSYTIVTGNQDVMCVYDSGNQMRYRLPKAIENKLM
jgi:hypothetical protein